MIEMTMDNLPVIFLAFVSVATFIFSWSLATWSYRRGRDDGSAIYKAYAENCEADYNKHVESLTEENP